MIIFFVGFLLLPWAFSKAGLLLSFLVLLVMLYFSILAAYFVVISMYRAVMVFDRFEEKTSLHRSSAHAHDDPDATPPINQLYPKHRNQQGYHSITSSYQTDNDRHKFSSIPLSETSLNNLADALHESETDEFKLYEITDLCSIFLGTCLNNNNFVIGYFGIIYFYCRFI